MKKIIGFGIAIFLVMGMLTVAYAEVITCWFPPGWNKNPKMALTITKALSAETGITIKPRISKSYPNILESFNSPDMSLVYVGSFAQAIIKARGLGTALVQNINGKDLYSGVLVYPKGGNPDTILKDNPEQVAFAFGSSSGESSAKAATGGKAMIGTKNHTATCRAVSEGRAKAGVVKNWWWDSNKDNFLDLAMYRIPEISIEKNPDNILTASKSVPVDVQKKIIAAAIKLKDVFGALEMVEFDQSRLEFTLELMAKGKIDPMTYSW